MNAMEPNPRAILLPPSDLAVSGNRLQALPVICFECDHRQQKREKCEKCGGSTEEVEFWHGPEFVENVGSCSQTPFV